MKILIINSRYFLSAGPERYMFGLEEILKKKGHEVIVFSTKNSKNKKTEYEEYFAEPIGGKDKVFYSEYKLTPKTVFQVIGRLFYSFYVRKKLDLLIRKTRPDVAYILHHYNKLSPSIIDACKKNDVRTIMRLSDFFLVCPEGHLFRDNDVCEECIHLGLHRAVRHSCVKGSRIASLLKASALWIQRKIGVYDKLDAVVSPSGFTIEKVKDKINAKIVHIPTFVELKEKENKRSGSYILAVGRIEKQKGLMDLIDAVRGTGMKLKIVGGSSTGYDKILKKAASDMNNVEFLGPKFDKELKKLYMEARAVAIPARWYENLPNVALEAMMYSRPVVVSDLGSLGDMIEHGKNGLKFKPGDISGLRKNLQLLYADDMLCRRLGKNAYKEIKNTYSPEKHYRKLMKVFEGKI